MGRYPDVLVVGGGLAGLSAAYRLARHGVDVLVLERGEYPGAKNAFGGILYTRIWEHCFGELLADMPVERFIERHVFHLISGSSYVALEHGLDRDEEEPENGCTILRSRFDQWFASKVESAGGKILCSAVAREPVIEAGRFCGVRLDGYTLRSPVVILAEGVNGLITRRFGLGRPMRPDQLGIGVKQVLALPERTIDERFRVRGGRGTASYFLGSCVEGLSGAGFLFTNRDTLSVGVVLPLEQVQRSGRNISKLLASFKESYPIRGLIEGATPKEYCAHLIPEAGMSAQPRLFADGVLVAGDAAAFLINSGIKIRGADLAVASGFAAAESAREALEGGDFSRQGLSSYRQKLLDMTVLKDMRTFGGAHDALKTPGLYGVYPELACSVLRSLLEVSPGPQPRIWEVFRREIGRACGWRRLLWDGIRMLKSI